MQLIDHSCADITCEAFNKPFTIECWDKDEEEYGEGNAGDPICDDYLKCGGCDNYCPHSEEVERALQKLLAKHTSPSYEGPDLWG